MISRKIAGRLCGGSVINVFNQHLFLSKQSFGIDPMFRALFDETIRLNDLAGVFGIFETHDITQPGLLPHGINKYRFAVESPHDVDSLIKVRPGQAARFIHGAFYLLRQQGAIKPAKWRPITFHTEEDRIDVSDLAIKVLIEPRFDIAGISRE